MLWKKGTKTSSESERSKARDMLQQSSFDSMHSQPQWLDRTWT